MKLNRVNDFLSKIEPIEDNVVLTGPDTIKNIVVSEIMDIQKLSQVSDVLFSCLSKDVKRLPRKEQQSFWRDTEAVLARKEDFIFKIAQETNKSEFLNKMFNAQPTEKVITETGEVFETAISEEQRTHLSALLVDMLNDNARD